MAEFVNTLCCTRFGCVKTLSRHFGRICRKAEQKELYFSRDR